MGRCLEWPASHSRGIRGARIASREPRTGDMAARTPVLDKTDLFGTLPPELLEQLRGRTALSRFRRGDAIFEKGDPATSLHDVFSGGIAIVAKASDGRESVPT